VKGQRSKLVLRLRLRLGSVQQYGWVRTLRVLFSLVLFYLYFSLT